MAPANRPSQIVGNFRIDGAPLGFRAQEWIREIGEYIDALEEGKSPITFREELGAEERRHEELFLGLRQSRGLPVAKFLALAGPDGEAWTEKCVANDWIRTGEGAVRFTSRGFLLSSELIAELF